MTADSKNNTATNNNTIDETNVSLSRRLRRMKRRLLFEHVLENDELMIKDDNDNNNTMQDDEDGDDGQITRTSTPLPTERSTASASPREKLRHVLPIHRINKLWRGSSSNFQERARD
jgi:hypothetical protein